MAVITTAYLFQTHWCISCTHIAARVSWGGAQAVQAHRRAGDAHTTALPCLSLHTMATLDTEKADRKVWVVRVRPTCSVAAFSAAACCSAAFAAQAAPPSCHHRWSQVPPFVAQQWHAAIARADQASVDEDAQPEVLGQVTITGGAATTLTVPGEAGSSACVSVWPGGAVYLPLQSSLPCVQCTALQ